MAKVHGIPLSPFVRKVRICLLEKGVEHEVNPVLPINQSEEFLKMSPLGKIPVYQDGDFTVPDSSVICAYLERVHPSPSVYPDDAKDYARALWFEEYADTKIVESAGALFFQKVINPNFFQQETDQSIVKEHFEERIPKIFTYLESQLNGGDALIGGRFSIADVAVGSQLQQLRHVGVTPEKKGFPRLAAYAEAVLGRDSFRSCFEEEKALLP